MSTKAKEEISSSDSSNTPSVSSNPPSGVWKTDGDDFLMTTPPKGYPVNIISKSSDLEHISCVICRYILRNPAQGPCGHRFCHNCLIYAIRQSSLNQTVCQSCAEENTEQIIKTEMIFPDRGVMKELQKLSVKCSEPGCQFSGKFKLYEEHFKAAHDECACPFGCNVKLAGNTELATHLNDNLVEHINQALQRLNALEANMPQSSATAASSEMESRIRNLEKDLKKLEEDSRRSSSISRSASGTVVGDLDGNISERFRILDAVMTVLSGEIAKLSEQFEKHEEISKMKRQKTATLEDGIANVSRKQDDMQGRLRELTERVKTLENISYDGTQMWKINEFSKRRSEAQSKQKPYIVSPAFYTSNTGYKLCARVYLNGDGQGINTHLSIFIVIMRGNYDALLKWPFDRRVTITVLNHTNSRQNRQDAFIPDPTHQAFQRPKENMNTASGLPKFISLADLTSEKNGFIRDDTLFIKIEVALGTDGS